MTEKNKAHLAKAALEQAGQLRLLGAKTVTRGAVTLTTAYWADNSVTLFTEPRIKRTRH